MSKSPSYNDRRYDLIYKQAINWKEAADSHGVSGLDSPELNDTEYDLLYKIVQYTKYLAT